MAPSKHQLFKQQNERRHRAVPQSATGMSAPAPSKAQNWLLEANRLKEEIRLALGDQQGLSPMGPSSHPPEEDAFPAEASSVRAADFPTSGSISANDSSISKLQEQVANVHTYVAVSAEKDRLINDLRGQLVAVLHRQQLAETEIAKAPPPPRTPPNQKERERHSQYQRYGGKGREGEKQPRKPAFQRAHSPGGNLDPSVHLACRSCGMPRRRRPGRRT